MRAAITRSISVISLVGMVLFAPGAAFASPPTVGNTGQNGPDVPKLGDPVAEISEVQFITVTVAANTVGSGSYRLNATDLTYGGPTVPIAFDASAKTMQTAFLGDSAAVPPVPAVSAPGTISVIGGPTSVNYNADNSLKGTWYYRVMWIGTEAGNNKGNLSVVNVDLNANVTVSVDVYQNGSLITTARNQPHGGYNATTDYCLQCHSVHNGGDYALLASTSVTATCRTCHSIGGGGPNGAINPALPGIEAPTSMRSAYEITDAATLTAGSQHRLGATNIPFGSNAVGPITESGWKYGAPSTWTSGVASGAGTSSDSTGGLYCGDCHTPHGDFGQLVNSKSYRSTAPAGALSDLSQVWPWQEGGAIYFNRAVKYLHKDTDPSGVWEACSGTSPAAIAGGPDTNCSYLTASDTEGESAYLYGYKLLSMYPNHSWNQKPVSWNMDANGHDIAQWCGRCHDQALPSTYGGTYHNHPTGCTACHGNPNDATSTDFPHTSTFKSFLKDYPDLLCINCHIAGNLP